MTCNLNKPLMCVFRLISERTVEENILKKANQKRMLGDMAIEGGNFTTAFFKQVLLILLRIHFYVLRHLSEDFIRSSYLLKR